MRFLFYFLLLLTCFTSLSASVTQKLIKAIDSRDELQIISIFNSMESIKASEATKLLGELYSHYFYKNSEKWITNYRRSFFYTPLYPDVNRCALGAMYSKTVFGCVRELSLLAVKKLVSTYDFYYINQFSCLMKIDNKIDDEDVPANLVLGIVEVLVGGLISILPFPGSKWLGGTIIADGVHRSFNGLSELDGQNRVNS